MVLSMPEIMFKLISLVLEGIKSLVFDFPAGAPAAHNTFHIPFADLEMGHPAEMLGLIGSNFPILNEIDQHVWVGSVQKALG